MEDGLRLLIGQRINILLSDNKETQKELAAVLSVTENTISYYVNGKRTPNIEQLIMISNHYNTTIDYLLGKTDNKTTDIEVQAISEYTGLNDKSISFLHYFVEECSNDDYKFNKQSLAFINYLFTGYSKSGNLEEFIDLLDLVDKYLSINNNQHDNYEFDGFSHEEMKEKIQYGISYEIQRIFGGFVKGFHDEIRKKTQRDRN